MNHPLFSFKNASNTKIYNGPSLIFLVRYGNLPYLQKASKLAENDYVALKQVLENEQIYKDINNFSKYYYHPFIAHLEENTLFEENLKEIQELLFKSLSKKYDLDYFIILALIILFNKEKEYQHYNEYIGSKAIGLESLIDKTIEYNCLYNNLFNVEHFKKRALQDAIKITAPLFSKIDTFIQDQYYATRINLKSNIISSFLEDEIEDEIDTFLRHNICGKLIGDKFNISFNKADYYFGLKDSVREGNKIDSFYYSHFRELLINTFNGCAKCHNLKMGENIIEFDHFWMPKFECGNFVMRSKSGYYVNNCIPLCKECNASKGCSSVFDVFNTSELLEIVPKSQSMNAAINIQMENFYDPDFPNRKIPFKGI